MPQQRAFCRREVGLPFRRRVSCCARHALPCRPGREQVDRHWGERGVVGLELGGFTLEGGVQGRELRHGFLGQGEALRVNFDADRLVAENHLMPGPRKERSEVAAH